jgi:subtilisin family serine protease
MRNVFFALLVLLGCASAAGAGTFRPAAVDGVKNEYLVVLNDGVAHSSKRLVAGVPAVAELAHELAARHGGAVGTVWENALHGFVFHATEREARALARDPRVLSVEQDARHPAPVSSPAYDCNTGSNLNSRPMPTTSPQTIVCSDPDPAHDTTGVGQPPSCIDNWGLDRIDQTSGARNGSYIFDRTGRDASTTVYVLVIDSGLYSAHPEFLDAAGHSRVWFGYNATTSGTSSDTHEALTNGHGTAVSGVIAARTYGVAKNVLITPVRVIDENFATDQWLINGLDWVAGFGGRPAVANLSGRNDSSIYSLTIQNAIRGVINAGIPLVQAAGNQSYFNDPNHPNDVKNACDYTFKGSVPGIIVAGGMDDHDQRWVMKATDPGFACGRNASGNLTGDCGSNVGPCVDIWAPAADILSTSFRGGYCRLSGTSLAAPFVTGTIALYLQAHPTATPAQVLTALRAGATSGVLDANPSSFNYIGTGSPNLLLYSRIP